MDCIREDILSFIKGTSNATPIRVPNNKKRVFVNDGIYPQDLEYFL